MKLRRLLGAVAVVLWAAFASAQPEGPLPPADKWPRTKIEWEKQEEEPWRGVGLGELVPDLWKAAWDRMTVMTAKYTGSDVIYDAALADQLIGELWVDTGHPSLNNGVQDFILSPLISEVLSWPDEQLPQTARDRIGAGLLVYVRAGGGTWTPCSQARVAALLALANRYDSEARELADQLLEDAVAWVSAIDSEILTKDVQRICAFHWGDEARWRVHEIVTRDMVPANGRSESFDKAVGALRALLRDDPPIRPIDLLERLRDAERAASVKQKDDRLNDDLVCRLLIVYRTLLDRRPRIAFRAAAHIENQLLTLHLKERLRTDRHWELWSQAVKALESERLSKRFQRYLRARADKKDLPPAEAKALATLRPLLAE